MNLKQYFQTFSMDELCEGAELILSGEMDTYSLSAQPDLPTALQTPYFQDRKILLLTAELKKKRGSEGSAAVWLDEASGRIIYSFCSCDHFRKDTYGCPHTAAALTDWFLKEHGEEIFAGTRLEENLKMRAGVEDPFAPGVMKRTDQVLLPYLQNHMEENQLPVWTDPDKEEASGEQIHVQPELDILEDGYGFELKAGIGRSYIIKDLPGFIKCYRKGDLYPFGRNTYLLSADTCDPFSRKLMDLLSKALTDFETYASCSYFQTNGQSKDLRVFHIPDIYLLDFLELYDKSRLVFTDGTQIPVDLDRKGLQLTLRKKAHGASLSVKRATLISQKEYLPLVLQDGEGIFSLPIRDKNQQNLIADLITQIEPLYIRESDLPALRQQVLPIFEACGEVITRGMDLKKYQKELPVLQAYFDLESKSRITCVPYVCYRQMDQRYRLFDNTQGLHHRNPEAENRFALTLSRIFQTYQAEDGKLLMEPDEETLYDFLNNTLKLLQEEAEVFITDRMKKLRVRNLPSLRVSIGMHASELAVGIRGEDLSKKELEEILSAYSVKKKYFRLKNGSFFNLEDADTQVWETLSDLYHHHGEKDPSLMKIPLYRALYLNEMLEERDSVLLEPDLEYRNLISSMDQAAAPLPLPGSLSQILRPYQKEGFEWICRLKQIGFGGILADDMGLGKTLQVLSFLLAEKENGRKGRTLIVCPASLVYNWQKEIARFTPALSCTVIAGTLSQRQELIAASQDSDIWITSYDLLKRDIASYETLSFANEILDEAQFIKNQHTQAAQSVRIVQADFRLALTGTPIENHLGELWSIMDYLIPGFLYPYARFQKEFELPISSGRDQACMEKLRRMVHPFILRRLKKDVLQDLPAKTEESVIVKLSGEQKRLYDAHASRLRRTLSEKSPEQFRSGKLEILAELTRLRQLCCDPALLYESYQGESAKEEACMQLIRQAVEGGHKVLLFSQFTSMLDILCTGLTREGYAYYRIDGSVSKEKRMDMVDNFAYDEVPVFCISLKAGGTGLNLTAADIVIHYDPWWNQAAQNQATDRAHRIGQTNPVTVYELIAGDTIEEQIQNIKKDKAKLMEDLLSGETISSASIDREELLQLLG